MDEDLILDNFTIVSDEIEKAKKKETPEEAEEEPGDA